MIVTITVIYIMMTIMMRDGVNIEKDDDDSDDRSLSFSTNYHQHHHNFYPGEQQGS